jgi:transposase-like protein
MVKSKFTSAEKSRIVLESLNTNISTAELCRKHNIAPQTFYSWKERFVEGGKASLNGTPNGDVCKNLQKENDSLKKFIGEITIANDILKKTLEAHKR